MKYYSDNENEKRTYCDIISDELEYNDEVDHDDDSSVFYDYDNNDVHDMNLKLLEAVKSGSYCLTELWIAEGAQINSVDEKGMSVIYIASKSGDVAMLNLLERSGADLNLQDKDSWTPLHFAVSKGNDTIVEWLLANGANINAKDRTDRTPLYIAAEFGHHTIVGSILKRFSNDNARYQCY